MESFPFPITIKTVSFLLTLALNSTCLGFRIVPLARFPVTFLPSRSPRSSNPSNALFHGCATRAKSFSLKTWPLDTFLVKLITCEVRPCVSLLIFVSFVTAAVVLSTDCQFSLLQCISIVRQSLSIRGLKLKWLLQAKNARLSDISISAFKPICLKNAAA